MEAENENNEGKAGGDEMEGESTRRKDWNWVGTNWRANRKSTSGIYENDCSKIL